VVPAKERIAIPKVFGLHEIELRSEVDPAEYERYFAEPAAMQPTLQGCTVKLLRADRGPRPGSRHRFRLRCGPGLDPVRTWVVF
jgi:hypothetical protein